MTLVWRLRAAALTLAGALLVHHGRYTFSSPGHEHAMAAAHAYLSALGPAAAVLVFLTVAQLVARLGRESAAGSSALPRTRTLWLMATATLLAVFSLQEYLEMLFSHGHPPQAVELLADGGWTAVPLAFAAGGGMALLLRAAAQAVLWASSRARRHGRRSVSTVARVPRAAVLAPPESVLARRLAGRAPPALS